MRLDELPWEPTSTDDVWAMAKIPGTDAKVYRALPPNDVHPTGHYAFYRRRDNDRCMQGTTAAAVSVEPIVAQAILFHLLDNPEGNL